MPFHRRPCFTVFFAHLLNHHGWILSAVMTSATVYFWRILVITHVYIHYVVIAIVIHLYQSCSWRSKRNDKFNTSTSSESFEFPQPSMSILDVLSGMTSRMIWATSLYVLNQSNDAPSDSLCVYQSHRWSISSGLAYFTCGNARSWCKLALILIESHSTFLPIINSSVFFITFGQHAVRHDEWWD